MRARCVESGDLSDTKAGPHSTVHAAPVPVSRPRTTRVGRPVGRPISRSVSYSLELVVVTYDKTVGPPGIASGYTWPPIGVLRVVQPRSQLTHLVCVAAAVRLRCCPVVTRSPVRRCWSAAGPDWTGPDDLSASILVKPVGGRSIGPSVRPGFVRDGRRLDSAAVLHNLRSRASRVWRARSISG